VVSDSYCKHLKTVTFVILEYSEIRLVTRFTEEWYIMVTYNEIGVLQWRVLLYMHLLCISHQFSVLIGCR
jgi:hypothetical protein